MAITPFNYKNPQKTTPTSGGSIAPYTYAAYTPPTPVVTESKQSLFSKVSSDFLNLGPNVITAATQAPAPKSLDMQSALNAGWDTISNTIQDTAKRITDAGTTLNSNASALDKVTAEGRVALGLVNNAFLGITAPLTAARGVPVVGYIADGISNFFSALGVGGSGYADIAVDSLPFSDKTKETIRPLAQEVGALIAQTKAGELTHGKVTELIDKSKQLTDVVHQGVQDTKANIHTASDITKANPTEATIPQFDYTKTPAENHAAYAKAQGYEPYTPPDQLPTIQTGPKASDTLPTIQTETPTSAKLGDLTLEPIKQATQDIVSSMETLHKATETGDIATAQTTLKDIQTKVSDLNAKVELQTADNSFNSRVFERLKAEHPEVLTGDLKVQKVKLEEDLNRATDLIKKDKQTAFEVAMSAKSSPDILSTDANIVLAEKALQEGNHDLYARLIKKRSLDQTRRGQEISAERGSVTDNSTSRYVKELIAFRLDNVGNGYLSDIKEKITRVSNKTKAVKRVDSEVRALETKIRTKKLDAKTAIALLDHLTCV